MRFVSSAPGDEPIVVEGWFAASPARVFGAFTDPEVVMQWFGVRPGSLVSAAIDLRPGGAWRFELSRTDERSAAFEGEYLAIEPGRLLAFSWRHVVEHAGGEREATPVSRVEIRFSPQGAGTGIRLVHSGLASEEARRNVGGGWDAAFAAVEAVLADRPPGAG